MKRTSNAGRKIVLGFVASASLFASAAFAEDGDAVKGEKVFKKCKACHAVGDGAKNKVGPVLNDIVGRKAGTFEGFKYASGLQAAAEKELVWTEDELFAYLKNPKKYLRKTLDDKKLKSKMSFKLKKKDQRRDVIAYLKTISKSE